MLHTPLTYSSRNTGKSYTGRVTGRVTTAYGHERRYDYTYDALGFLTEARYSSTDSVKDFSARYTYDRQANLTSMLQRNKTTALSMRQLPTLIVREGNRVKSVSVNGILKPSEPVIGPSLPAVTAGFIEDEPLPILPWFNGKDYGYDANGNLTYDRDRNITAIAYNAAGRPQSVTFANGDVTRYVYTAAGEKLAEAHASRDGLSDARRMRLGAFSFTDGRLERTELPQGYLDTLGTLHAYIADFQGNIVGVCREGGGLEQFTDYYPYGTPHPDARHPEANRRKYGGKELLTEGGLNEYDFEARRLTPLGSFSQPDPLASKYPWLSPYAYCAADPINSIDPTGENGILVIDIENREITVVAKYFVVTEPVMYRTHKGGELKSLSGYNSEQIKEMNNMNEALNKANYVVTKGSYEGFTVKFDLQFTESKTIADATECAEHAEYGETGVNIGNTIEINNEYRLGVKNISFATIELSDGTTETVGGLTWENRTIMMNASQEQFKSKNLQHEIFHTLGLSHPPRKGGPDGIMHYPPQNVNKRDINNLLKSSVLKHHRK